ncbi:hypothetical protein EUGRSUZ_J02899 [Eucalyptus grandis]|uniref:Uncharacterized protein n=2 Tax=Eucalyptus grandis TaxID=71139 RepID=A0ACC3J9Z0_EUCGR|nr:hypothetical protein EUGRSUZ_J02899 [Eucalyptus grandis]
MTYPILLRLVSRLENVAARLDTQAKMTTIIKSMGSIIKSLEPSLATGNLQKMSETMDSFEKQFVNVDDYRLDVSVGLPQLAAHALQTKSSEKVDEDDLSRQLAELKARG